MRWGGKHGTKELKMRVVDFEAGRWDKLLQESRETGARVAQRAQEPSEEATVAKIELLVSRGELSHAARLLRSMGLAPGTLETLRQLTDPRLRPPDRLCATPAEVFAFVPDEAVELDRSKFAANLKSTRRGLSPGVGAHRNEHLKLALGDESRRSRRAICPR